MILTLQLPETYREGIIKGKVCHLHTLKLFQTSTKVFFFCYTYTHTHTHTHTHRYFEERRKPDSWWNSWWSPLTSIVKKIQWKSMGTRDHQLFHQL